MPKRCACSWEVGAYAGCQVAGSEQAPGLEQSWCLMLMFDKAIMQSPKLGKPRTHLIASFEEVVQIVPLPHWLLTVIKGMAAGVQE